VEGVDYMHKKDIIHNNLDPQHIFITENMLVKIIGFSDVRVFKGVAVGGNLSYASPEQLMGKFVDHRTDLFQLGMIFYELFSGRPPFSPSKSNYDRIRKIMIETPFRMEELDTEYRFLERVVLRLLEKKPDKRYQSAQELLNDLNRNKADRQQGTWHRPLPE
jgi:serine/threonine-protein kinase